MSISSIPANSASAITPFNPLGKQAVGEEEKDSKNSSLKAVEESSESERNRLRRDGKEQDEKITALKEDEQEKNEDEQAREEKQQHLQEQEEIRQLAARDREVRDHERAHTAVGGQYAGAPSYRFERGPDGVNYAIAGEVRLETGTVRNDPQATLDKAQQIRRAALAPADPSAQDRRVAAQAAQIAVEAREALSDKRREEIQQEKAEAQQRAEDREATAAAKENTGTHRDEETGVTTPSNRETNQRLVAVSHSYLDLAYQNNRLGGIVSEVV